MTKRISLQPAPLVIALERVASGDGSDDYIDVTITRGELHVASAEVSRGDMPSGHHLTELSVSERHQVNAALVAEWLDWKPSDAADDVPVENILELFDRLKQSLIDGGVIKADGSRA